MHAYSKAGWFDDVVAMDDGKETSTTPRRVKVGLPAAVEIWPEGSATTLVSGASSVAFKSFEQNASGAKVDPRPDETVFQRFQIRNLGSEKLTFDTADISVPANVALVGVFPTSLASDGECVFTVRWTAREPLD